VFVTLEGIDRSGKTTQAALLAEALGPETLLVREPGGTPLGERVRELLKDPGLALTAGAELLLFNAARAQLCEEVLGPAREAGRDIVCDRFIDSTVAYQGVARELGVDLVERLSQLVVGGCVPDLTILLRIDPALAEDRGCERASSGERDGDDRFESEGLEFQRTVAEAYDEIAVRDPERIVVVEADAEASVVHERVLVAVRSREHGEGRL
jgi:dTMP kinase